MAAVAVAVAMAVAVVVAVVYPLVWLSPYFHSLPCLLAMLAHPPLPYLNPPPLECPLRLTLLSRLYPPTPFVHIACGVLRGGWRALAPLIPLPSPPPPLLLLLPPPQGVAAVVGALITMTA